MGEAKRRKEAGSGPRDGTPEWELDLGWEKAAALATGVIERANAEGMQVFVRPTTAPSPHGPDSPLEIEAAEDGAASRSRCPACPKRCAANGYCGLVALPACGLSARPRLEPCRSTRGGISRNYKWTRSTLRREVRSQSEVKS